MTNTHNNQTLTLVKTSPAAASANGPVDEYAMPDPFDVARLLGNKGERFPRELQQGLMNGILDNAPQRPSRWSRTRTSRSKQLG
jgi:hypothetical protein